MRNIIILGTGRSGTSMVAATFRSSGAFMGDQLIKATLSNPHGYYEDRYVNRLNNDFIRRLVGPPLLGWRIRGKFFRTVHTVPGAFFMAAPRRIPELQPTPEEIDKIRSFTKREPFCFKDPRFSLTLPIWLPYLPADTGFVVVFRDPMRTVASMIRHAWEEYQPALPVTENWGYVCWQRTYLRLLRFSEGSTKWIFVNYDSLLEGSGTTRLSEFVGCALNFSQIDRKTSRSAIHDWPKSRVGQDCRAVYDHMRELASTPEEDCLARTESNMQR